MYFDLGVYLNELVCDNAHPKGTGVAYYMQNWSTNEEIEYMTRKLFELHHPEHCWSMQDSQCNQAVQQTKQCMVLNNYYCALWAIMMLSESDETDPSAFNWEFALGRTLMHKKCVLDWQIGQI